MAKGTTRRERERQEHVRHILDVAESTFAQKGFIRTTMRQIAVKAEFALGTLYAYFESKLGLYRRIVEARIADMVAHVLREMDSEVSARGQIEKFIHAKMAFLRENLPFLRLYLAEVNVPERDTEHILPEGVREKHDSMLRRLTAAIAQGIREGLFKPMDAEALARALDALTNAFALSWLGSDTQPTAGVDEHVAGEVFFHGVAVSE